MQGAGTGRRRLGLWGVALLVAAAACTPSDGDDDPAGPEPTPEATEEPTEEPDEEEAEATEALATIARQVSTLRGLELEEEIPTELVSPDELAEVVTERDRDAEAIERLAASGRVLAALRHVPADVDLEAVVDDLQAASIVGLYDPEATVAYISTEEVPLGPSASTTAAHELIHALQDQHFDLSRLDDIPPEEGDAALAFLSVVEGDAVLLEEEWAATHQTDEERQAADREQVAGAGEQLAALEDVPSYVVETFVFPYVAGERFVAALIEEGGYEAVDAALEEPPMTTLEVLSPEAYLDGFEPAHVEPGVAPAEDFEEIMTSSFGAFDLLALFGAADSTEAQAGAAAWPAWRGGALAAWERGDDLVVAGAWRFEGAERASDACAALPAWYGDVADGQEVGDDVLEGDRDALVLDCDGSDVRFALSPDATLAEAALKPE